MIYVLNFVVVKELFSAPQNKAYQKSLYDLLRGTYSLFHPQHEDAKLVILFKDVSTANQAIAMASVLNFVDHSISFIETKLIPLDHAYSFLTPAQFTFKTELVYVSHPFLQYPPSSHTLCRSFNERLMEMGRDLMLVVSTALASPYDEHIKAKIGVCFERIVMIKKNVSSLETQQLSKFLPSPPPLPFQEILRCLHASKTHR